jgi:xylulokinase
VSKWAWLRAHDPAAVAATRAVRLPHDYLTERLTGRAVTDRGDASGTGWWSSADEAYATDILGLSDVDLDPRWLPPVLGPAEAAGEVGAAAAADLGLSVGTIVGPGTGDNMAAALAMDLAVGQPVLSLGTSGTVYAVSERRATDPTGVVAGFADASGRFLPLACTLNCTLAVDRTAGWLGLGREDVSPAESVVVLPWLDGERTPDLPGASGTIVGLRHATTPQQILMATYEGAVASLLEALAAVEAASGAQQTSGDASPLVVIGGGARGVTWRNVVRRLSGRPLVVPDAEELVAIGAAVQATAILRGEAPSVVARRWDTLAGTRLDPLPLDERRVTIIAAVRDAIEAEAAFSGSRA